MSRFIPRAVALAVALAIGIIACGPPPEIQQAGDLLARGAYADAATAADRALVAHPDHPEPWRIKIQAAIGQRDATRAVAIYDTWYQKRGQHDRTVVGRMALTTLWQGLRVPSGTIRSRAIQAVERLEIEKLARDVTRLMGDDDDRVAAAAAVAVLRSNINAPDVATQLLRSDIAEARAVVIEGLGRKIKQLARDDLVRALGDPSPVVRRAATSALAPLGDARDTERFIQLAARDPDAEARALALDALAAPARKSAPTTAAARAALDDEYGAARLAAVAILDAHEDLAALNAALGASDVRVALRAAVALGRRTPGAHAPLVLRALGDATPEVRAAAIDAVDALLPGDLAVVRARTALGDSASAVQLAGARALRRLGQQREANAAFIVALAASDAATRLSAAIEVQALGDERGLAALSDLARSAAHPESREAAIRAHSQAAALSPGLIAGLADPSPHIRIIAAEVLLGIVGT